MTVMTIMFLDHLGMTCQPNMATQQVRWFFRPATHISARGGSSSLAPLPKSDWHLDYGSWWFQRILYEITTWTDDLFLTGIFRMFFFATNKNRPFFYLTLRWWFSWRRIMEPFISWVVFQHSLGPKVEGFFGNKAMAMIEKDLAIDIELWPVQVQDTKKWYRYIELI